MLFMVINSRGLCEEEEEEGGRKTQDQNETRRTGGKKKGIQNKRTEEGDWVIRRTKRIKKNKIKKSSHI